MSKTSPINEETIIVELTEEEYERFMETGELPESAGGEKPPTFH